MTDPCPTCGAVPVPPVKGTHDPRCQCKDAPGCHRVTLPTDPDYDPTPLVSKPEALERIRAIRAYLEFRGHHG